MDRGRCLTSNVKALTDLVSAQRLLEGFPTLVRIRDSFVFLPMAKIMVSSRRAGTSDAHSHRNLSFESLSDAKKTTPKGCGLFWQRMRDSNPRERSQSPVCYRYTNPLCVRHGYYYNDERQNVKSYFS